MDTGLIVAVAFIVVMIASLVPVFWFDWKSKCRKTVKENNLVHYVNGYSVLRNEDNGTLVILSGVMGVNSKDIIFENRFKDETLKIVKSIADVQKVESFDDTETDYIDFIRNNFDMHEGKIRYILINMAGYSITNKMDKIPNILKSRKMCRIKFTNDDSLLFFYKNSKENNEAIRLINQFIRRNKETI